MNEKHVGSDFDDFLQEEGILHECTEIAQQRVLKWSNQDKKSSQSSPNQTQNIKKPRV